MNILLIHGKYLPIYNKYSRGAIEKLERIYLEYNDSKEDKFTVYSPKIAKDNFDAKVLKNTSFRNIDLASWRSKTMHAFFALKHHILKMDNNEYYIRQIIRDIKRRGEENFYDLIIFENEEGSIPIFRRKTGTKTRIVLHLHNDYVSIDRKNSKEILDNCNEVWCVSKFVESRIREVKKIKTVVIPNTTDTFPPISEKEVAKLKERYNPAVNKVFLYVGRLIEVKGVRELIDAFNIYNKNNKNAKMIIIGDSGGSRNNRKFIKQIHSKIVSNPNIDAVGYKSASEIANYYKTAHVQVVPSRWNEAFGLVVLEAMQGGVRIIASGHGAFREICGEKALYVSKEKMVEDLVEKMSKVSRAPIRGDYYESILKKYTIEKFLITFSNALHGATK